MKDERAHLSAMLTRYATVWPDEVEVVGRIRALVEARGDCLWRSCFEPGHVTASAWIVSPDRRLCLLTHHRKLGRWLQLGGHVDGEPRVERAALSEAREESGIEGFVFVPADGDPVPVDLDVHGIPAHGAEPAHEHHDVRFLLEADPSQPVVVSDESHDVRWVAVADLGDYTREESVLRLARKAEAVSRPDRPRR